MAETTTQDRRERELQVAREEGRWLSDDEHEAIEQQHQQRIVQGRRDSATRNKLIILSGVCVLIPPLWPVALGLTLYLLFPKSVTRIGLVAGLILGAMGVLMMTLLAFLTVWLINLIF